MANEVYQLASADCVKGEGHQDNGRGPVDARRGPEIRQQRALRGEGRSIGRVVIGYVRVSTPGQAAEGVSLDAQRAKLAAWCELHGHELAELHEDAGLSGKRADNRPGLQAAIAAACRSHGILVVFSLSRMARSTRDAIDIAERLQRAKADLVSISEQIDTTSAAGRFVFRMFASLAELEREQTGERTRLALAHRRANGKRVSRHPPYGFEHGDEGQLVPVPVEQIAIERARELRSGGCSLREIGRRLEVEGIVGRTGQRLTASTIRAVVGIRR